MTDETTLAGSAEQDDSAQPDPTEGSTAETEQTEATEAPDADAKSTDDKPDPSKEEDSKPDTSEEDKPKRKPASERIGELTAKFRTAERAKQAAEERAKRLEERLKTYETPPPKESDFDSYDEYTAALSAHQYRQANKQERQSDVEDARHEVEQAEREANEALAEAYNERVTAFAETVPDFHQKVADPTLPISPAMARHIQSSEQGPQIAYYLANNRADAARLAKLSNETDVAREIGRIEGRLTLPAPKRVSSAPDPVKPVATGAGSQADFNPSKASVDDIAARLRAKGIIS